MRISQLHGTCFYHENRGDSLLRSLPCLQTHFSWLLWEVERGSKCILFYAEGRGGFVVVFDLKAANSTAVGQQPTKHSVLHSHCSHYFHRMAIMVGLGGHKEMEQFFRWAESPASVESSERSEQQIEHCANWRRAGAPW